MYLAAAAASQKVATYEEIAAYDVVLTTYNVLREEVHYNTIMPYGLRGEKRYAIPETPLLTLHWFRYGCFHLFTSQLT
jgi:hypothetical protein